MVDKRIKLIDKIRQAKKLSDYPCDVYLHNALRFINQNSMLCAYSEVCYAITASGGKLSEEEKELWRKCNG